MGNSSTLKACLDSFKDTMQQQLQQAMAEYPTADIECKLKFLQQEVRSPCEGRGWMPVRGCASKNEH